MRTSARPTDRRESFVPICRPTAHKPVTGQPLCDAATVFVVHRWHGKTIPCQGTPCLFCNELLRTEERIFLPILRWESHQTELLDVPASHWSRLDQYKQKTGSLRDIAIKAIRTRRKDNAPISITARALTTEDVSDPWVVDPIPLVLAITASNVEKATFDILTAKEAAIGWPEKGDRHATRV